MRAFGDALGVECFLFLSSGVECFLLSPQVCAHAGVFSKSCGANSDWRVMIGRRCNVSTLAMGTKHVVELLDGVASATRPVSACPKSYSLNPILYTLRPILEKRHPKPNTLNPAALRTPKYIEPGTRTSKPLTQYTRPLTLYIAPLTLSLDRSPYTLHRSPCTLHPSPCTLHPHPTYTLHPSPFSIHLVLHRPTPNPEPRTPNPGRQTPNGECRLIGGTFESKRVLCHWRLRSACRCGWPLIDPNPEANLVRCSSLRWVTRPLIRHQADRKP